MKVTLDINNEIKFHEEGLPALSPIEESIINIKCVGIPSQKDESKFKIEILDNQDNIQCSAEQRLINRLP